MLLAITILAVTIFVIYFFISMFLAKNLNTFLDKWLTKSMWLWLPFVALWRLTKDVILKKK